MYERKRISGSVPEYTCEELQRVFAGLPMIKAAVLFGSRAVGKARSISDYDFAVSIDPDYQPDWGPMANIYATLAEQLKLADSDLDVVDLAKADTAVLSGIQDGFLLLKGNEDELRRIFEEKLGNSH